VLLPAAVSAAAMPADAMPAARPAARILSAAGLSFDGSPAGNSLLPNGADADMLLSAAMLVPVPAAMHAARPIPRPSVGTVSHVNASAHADAARPDDVAATYDAATNGSAVYAGTHAI